jgi:very-long-chain (3R)-3-hydroxyacyl-CoA dehydratase
MDLKKAYLVLYNLACCLGWAYALFLAGGEFFTGAGSSGATVSLALSRAWGAAAQPLSAVQWAMCLEVLHAAVGLVPSPVSTTFLQVLSRIVVLVAVTHARGTQGAPRPPPPPLGWPR